MGYKKVGGWVFFFSVFFIVHIIAWNCKVLDPGVKSGFGDPITNTVFPDLTNYDKLCLFLHTIQEIFWIDSKIKINGLKMKYLFF